MDLDFWDCFGWKKTQSYSRRNTVHFLYTVLKVPSAARSSCSLFLFKNSTEKFCDGIIYIMKPHPLQLPLAHVKEPCMNKIKKKLTMIQLFYIYCVSDNKRSLLLRKKYINTECKRRVVVLLFYVHGKHLRSCRDGQLT